MNIELPVQAVPKPGGESGGPGASSILLADGQPRGIGKDLSASGPSGGRPGQGRMTQSAANEAFSKALEDALEGVLGGPAKPDDSNAAGADKASRKTAANGQEAGSFYGLAMASAASLAESGSFAASGALSSGADAPGAIPEVGIEELLAPEDASRASHLHGGTLGTEFWGAGSKSDVKPQAGRTAVTALGAKAETPGSTPTERSSTAGRDRHSLYTGEAADAAGPQAQVGGKDQLGGHSMSAEAIGSHTGRETHHSAGQASPSAAGAGRVAAEHAELPTAGSAPAGAVHSELWTDDVETIAASQPHPRTAGWKPGGAIRTTAPQAHVQTLGESQSGPWITETAPADVDPSRLPTSGTRIAAASQSQPQAAEVPTVAVNKSKLWTAGAQIVAEGHGQPRVAQERVSVTNKGRQWAFSRQATGTRQSQLWMVQTRTMGADETGPPPIGVTLADAGAAEARAVSSGSAFGGFAQAAQNGMERLVGQAGQAVRQGPREFEASGVSSYEETLPGFRNVQRRGLPELFQTAKARGPEASEEYRVTDRQTVETADLAVTALVKHEDTETGGTGPVSSRPRPTSEDTVPRSAKAGEYGLLHHREVANTSSLGEISQTQLQEAKATAPSEGGSPLTGDAQPEPVPAQIVRRAALELGPRGGRVTVSLVPEHLGRVELEVALRDGRLIASLRATSHEVRNRLEADIGTLRESLQSLGLNVAEIRVSSAWDPAGAGTGSGSFGGEFGAAGQEGTGRWGFGAQRDPNEGAQRSWQFDLSFATGGQDRGGGHPSAAYGAAWTEAQGYPGQGQRHRIPAFGRAAAQGSAAFAEGRVPVAHRIDVVV